MTDNTVECARGRWREILPQLGIDTKFLSKKHGPCPLCGGRDRFYFDDRDGSGSYFCRQCGPGVGVILIRKLHGWDHATACREIDKIIGRKPQPPNATPTRAQPEKSANDGERRRKAILRLLDEARDPQIVADYLRSRGIVAAPPVLRGHPRCPYFNDGRLIGHFPAVIAPILGPDGSLESVQRIYIADIDPHKKAVSPVSTIIGAAVRLFEAGVVLGIAEGIVTALSAHAIFRVPVWAVLSDRGIKTFDPPKGIERLHIFADNNLNYTGQAAAYDRAHRLALDQRREITVQVHLPTVDGTDFNDVLRAQQ